LGRRDADVHDPARWVFNRLAADYLRRPDYPAALVERLLELAGQAGEAGAAVAELGAGVGHLALPLARLGARVAAVEPAQEMLAALRARAQQVQWARAEAVTLVHAAGEQTGLPPSAFGLVVLADALQWVDPERTGREVARILSPEGCLAIVEARFADTPFMQGLAALITESNPKARPQPAGRARQLLTLATDPPWTAEQFTQEALLSGSDLEAVLRSVSTVGPALGPARLDELLARAHALAEQCGGARFQRDLTLTWGRRRKADLPT
jgi:ubiquinone/menaquinone biosynthesis C-methylase UbiE